MEDKLELTSDKGNITVMDNSELVYDSGEIFSGFDWENGDPNYNEIWNSVTNDTNDMDNNSNTGVGTYGPMLAAGAMFYDGDFENDAPLPG